MIKRRQRERGFLLHILRPLQVCLSGRIDSSCVCVCSCLLLSHCGASPLFPGGVPEVSACSPALSEPRHQAEPLTPTEIPAPVKWPLSPQPTWTCTRPPFVVLSGDSRFSRACKQRLSGTSRFKGRFYYSLLSADPLFMKPFYPFHSFCVDCDKKNFNAFNLKNKMMLLFPPEMSRPSVTAVLGVKTRVLLPVLLVLEVRQD